MASPGEPTDARPLSVRIADTIRGRIEAGELAAGAQIPTLDVLAVEFGCSLAAVRPALDLLRQHGLIVTRHGKGSFVRDVSAARRRIVRGQTVTRDPARGYVFPAAAGPDEPWQTHGQPRAASTPLPAAVAAILDLPAGTAVIRRRRVTSPAGEGPFQLVDAWIHPDAVRDAPRAGEPDTGPGGYLDRLEEAGHGPIAWRELFRVRQPTQEEARFLQIAPALAVIELTRIGQSAKTGKPIDVTVCVIPSDRVEFTADLHRDRSARWPTAPVRPATP